MLSNKNPDIGRFNKSLLKGVSSLFFLLLLSLIVNADEGKVVSFHDQDPSSDDFVNAFMGGNKKQTEALPEGLLPTNNAQGGEIKFRGISLQKNKPMPKPEQKESMEQQFTANQSANACMAGKQSVAVNIRFNSNSSKVKNQDTAMLQKIAKAMNSPQLKHCYFVIEGHTDSAGADYYNLWLSQQRAGSVKRYLSQYKIANDRMIVVGKGEQELLNARIPNAPENRRVQFKVINYAQ